MYKKNHIKKFFEDYPIIFVIITFLVFGAGVTYWLSQKPKKADIVSKHKAQIVSEKKVEVAQETKEVLLPKPEREVRITPVPDSISAMVANQIESSFFPQKTEEPLPIKSEALQAKPKIVFIIDDLGYNQKNADLLLSIDRPLTIAILPHLKFSQYYLEEGKKHGFEMILHQPLQPESTAEDPGPGLITVDMKTEEIETILEENLKSVPGIVGINNHMGSKATKDRKVMYIITKKLREKKLFFLDSMTASKSVGYQVAFAVGVPTAKRDVFLDNVDEYDKIMEQIKETARVAKERGKAIAIGHIRKNTLQAIKDSMPDLESQGFELTTLTKVVK